MDLYNFLVQNAAYNVWANHKYTFQLLDMPTDNWMAPTPSSFNSLYKTILHMWDAESGWWQRMRLHESIVLPSLNFEPSMKDACNGLLHQSMQWETFIQDQLDSNALNTNLIYKNSTGEVFNQPVSQVIMHVFNHSTYHRGQLTNMMRALQIEKIPTTDFIAFCRTRDSENF